MKTKSLLFGMLGMTLIACQSNQSKELADQAILIHDEIMPQISSFDKATIEIDSILSNLENIKSTKPDLDTTNTRVDLNQLKTDLEDATDNMMTWMKEYSLDSADIAYQQAEVDKVTAMKKQFETVSTSTTNKLNLYK